jgi:hypothetical protein
MAREMLFPRPMRMIVICVAFLAACNGSAPLGGPLTLSLTPFSVEPKTDQVYCQYLPPDGKDRWIDRFTIDLGPGSHHLIVFRVNDRKHMGAWGPRPCDQFELPDGVEGMLPGAQQAHSELALPDGVAMRLGPEHGVFLQAHFINATQQSLTANATWHADTVEPSRVREQAGMIFYSQWNLDVPPGRSQQSDYCLQPEPRKLLLATGHMHRHGVAFDASAGGTPIYHTDRWDEPGGVALDDFPVAVNEPITWSCDYQNDTSDDLKFGPSASANEMCIFAALFHPSKTGDTDFGCNKPD